jgi:hypothetical protein
MLLPVCMLLGAITVQFRAKKRCVPLTMQAARHAMVALFLMMISESFGLPLPRLLIHSVQHHHNRHCRYPCSVVCLSLRGLRAKLLL